MFERFKKNKKITVTPTDNDEEQKVVKLSKEQIKAKEAYIEALMNKAKLPIIILDNEWYKIKPLVNNESIEQKEKKLKELIKEQAALIQGVKQDKTVKQNLMQDVLKVSDRINTTGDANSVGELEKLHQGIVKIGNELTQKEEKLSKMEEEIQVCNLELLEEAVAIGYEYMEICRIQSGTLGSEIDKLRELVVEKTSKKKVYDQQVNVLYQYLHNMIGYKHIDKVDKALGETHD